MWVLVTPIAPKSAMVVLSPLTPVIIAAVTAASLVFIEFESEFPVYVSNNVSSTRNGCSGHLNQALTTFIHQMLITNSSYCVAPTASTATHPAADNPVIVYVASRS